jgi:hypothetical protein
VVVSNPRGGEPLADDKRTENEAVFRTANERLKDRLSGIESNGQFPFICECSDAGCLEAVELTIPVYEQVRAQGERRFFVLPGHNGEGERVVAHGDGFVVVEKFARDGESFPSTSDLLGTPADDHRSHAQ